MYRLRVLKVKFLSITNCVVKKGVKMALIDFFSKQCPQWTTAEAEEAERALLRYFELLYKIQKEKIHNEESITKNPFRG